MSGRAARARPDIAFFIELNFPSVADTERQWEFNEILGLGIKAVERVIARAADPHIRAGGRGFRVRDVRARRGRGDVVRARSFVRRRRKRRRRRSNE